MEPKVIKTEQASVLTLAGQAEKRYRVHFMVGENGPFVEDFSAAEFVPERVRERIQAVAETLRKIQ